MREELFLLMLTVVKVKEMFFGSMSALICENRGAIYCSLQQ
jgi:hypothetical protein